MKKSDLVILPGWGGCKETWQDFYDYLQENSIKQVDNIYVINLPCFGGQPCPDKVWGVENYANFVEQTITEKINTDKVYLLGHSFGGAVATKLCYNNPKLINKMILTAPAIVRPEKTFKRLFFGLIAKAGKLLFKLPYIEKFDIWAKKVLYKTVNSDYNKTSGIKRDIYKKIIREDQRNLLSDIKKETLLIWGKKDKLLPYRHSKKIIEKLPNAKLKTISDGSHGLHKSNKSKLKQSIEAFLAK
jgi:pimeloyl-ACP methyl ester carboxylesterase